MVKPQDLPPLSEAQLELMNIVWLAGECSVADVLEQLSARRTVTRNTVQTMLSRLDEKGWLIHRDDGGTFIYRASVPRERVQQQRLEQVVETVFDGSTAGILMALLKDSTLTSEEANRIRKMIDHAEKRP